jgi:predicted nucleotidyltransferase
MPENFVQGNVAYNSTLAPEAWRHGRLRREVRYKLLRAAKFFIDQLDIPGFRVYDVVLTGSMANYNYTKYSDFDVHVVTKYSELECDDIAEEFYQAKKKIWNDNHDIMVRGHEVELYVEDAAQPPVAAGIYSLLDDGWIREPEYSKPGIDQLAINAKVKDLVVQINKTIAAADDPEDITRLFAKLRKMRQSGLDSGGEFSVENLIYKILRNMGYLDKMSRARQDQQDADLSLR